MPARRAVYAGSFDPVTLGHSYMIEQGAKLFDELVVAVGTNPLKTSYFPLEQRLEFLRGVCKGCPNVRIDQFTGELLVTYARRIDAAYVLRGMRSQTDYEYERTMRNINADMAGDVTTVFLMPPRELAEVSSSFVKALVGLAGWEELVARYVPAPVLEAFKKRKKA
jgi:pantetheine-phosphate adenylyltransferase